MTRLRTRLIAAFLAATVLPLAATIWITTSLLDRSLGYATTGEIDRLSRTLEATVRQFYQREREALKEDALSGRAVPVLYSIPDAREWPAAVRSFWESGEPERFGLSGVSGDHVEYMRRRDAASDRKPSGVEAFSRDLRGIRMDQLTADLRQTRELVQSIESRDLRRGFTLTLLLLLGAAWLVSLVPLMFIAHRVTQPIQRLTAALTDFADSDGSRRLETSADVRGAPGDEVALAIHAFNRMATQLQQSRERLVQVTRMASWQSLARKTAHELKNSLTPIRLAVEEMQARQPAADRAFMDRAVHIVVSEIDSLERRVRAFSEFSSEPPIAPEPLDVNAVVAERVTFLRPAQPQTIFTCRLDPREPRAYAGADLVRGIVTNLLQNAAEAAGPGGSVLLCTSAGEEQIVIEVHDSGPGLSDEARATLFQPTITFKKRGMGLGLSIAKSHALLSAGDVVLIDGELGGAAFRVTLPAVTSRVAGKRIS
jgi:nitrogen fixation/metabolism regulation signal transduction histidine kinase